MKYCALCKRSEAEETRTNYLRPVYIDAQGKLLSGFYKPHLTPQERWKLKAAGGKEQWVCSNRKACEQRMKKQQELPYPIV